MYTKKNEYINFFIELCSIPLFPPFLALLHAFPGLGLQNPVGGELVGDQGVPIVFFFFNFQDFAAKCRIAQNRNFLKICQAF